MQLQAVNVNQLSSKMKSKKELYNFLLQDGQAYLPPIHSTNVYFLKQIIRGVKDVSFIAAKTFSLYNIFGETRYWWQPCHR
jgi:hypothetical protein